MSEWSNTSSLQKTWIWLHLFSLGKAAVISSSFLLLNYSSRLYDIKEGRLSFLASIALQFVSVDFPSWRGGDALKSQLWGFQLGLGFQRMNKSAGPWSVKDHTLWNSFIFFVVMEEIPVYWIKENHPDVRFSRDSK